MPRRLEMDGRRAERQLQDQLAEATRLGKKRTTNDRCYRHRDRASAVTKKVWVYVHGKPVQVTRQLCLECATGIPTEVESPSPVLDETPKVRRCGVRAF